MIWLIGHRGMLGSDVEALLREASREHVASDKEVDITDYSQLKSFSADKKIDRILNCSAYTAVDRAEDEEELACRINGEGVANIARIAREKNARLVHISTDYVFSGAKEGAYTEDDETGPIGAYGRSKLLGEEHVKRIMDDYAIVRTAWLYGMHGPNFVRTMIKLFNEREEVRVVADQWGSPTYSRDLASAVLAVASSERMQPGIYHFANEGKTNWYEFACAIYERARSRGLAKKDVSILPITTEEYPTKAARPKNSYLSKVKIKKAFGLEIRDWRAALDDYIRALAGSEESR